MDGFEYTLRPNVYDQYLINRESQAYEQSEGNSI
jgi:hypothetical protein